MKKTILILLTALSSCGYEKPVIISKAYTTNSSVAQLPPCICYYEYQKGLENRLFQDSCSKYQIGDTLNLHQ